MKRSDKLPLLAFSEGLADWISRLPHFATAILHQGFVFMARLGAYLESLSLTPRIILVMAGPAADWLYDVPV